jgi:predicted dienelactone hydrolase
MHVYVIGRPNAGKKISAGPLRWFLATLAVAVLTSACATRHPPPVAEQKIKAPGRNAYVPERRYTKTALQEIWHDGDTAIDISLVRPGETGTFPLLVYLPGLGETPTAGALWRDTWAEAGYAVLSVQDQRFGTGVLTTARARAGDFRSLAREQYAPAALDERLRAIEFALAEVKRRVAAAQAPWSGIDTNRVAIAGFDVGAQTAAIIAGEASPQRKPATDGWNLRATILLSPYVDLAAGGLDQRYAAMTLPVLSITGSEDRDSFGAVDSPSLHRAPWQYMPAGDKYLLVLEGGTHMLLGGSAPGEHKPAAEAAATKQTGWPGADASPLWDNEGGSGGGGKRRGKRPDKAGPGGDGGDGFSRGMDMQLVGYVQGLTTAFLDATVKGDPVAREWLDRNATRWLDDVGVFRIK